LIFKNTITLTASGQESYNPGGDADGWRRALSQQFGSGAEKVKPRSHRREKFFRSSHGALSVRREQQLLAGNVLEHADGQRQPQHPYTDTASPKLFGNVSPLDPEFFQAAMNSPVNCSKPNQRKVFAGLGANQLDDAAKNAADNLRAAKSKTRGAKARISAGSRRM